MKSVKKSERKGPLGGSEGVNDERKGAYEKGQRPREKENGPDEKEKAAHEKEKGAHEKEKGAYDEEKGAYDELREAIVAPGSLQGKGRKEMLEAFRSIRKKLAEGHTEEDEQIARFLQLKFLIEDYLSTDIFTNHYFFGYFLKEYISRQDKKNKEFAWEIDVDPAELSLIINRHRKPTEKLIFRLDIHSNRNFPAQLWFKVLEKDREIELSRNSQLIDREKKHVKRKLSFSL